MIPAAFLKPALVATAAALVASLVASGVLYVRLASAQRDTSAVRTQLAEAKADHARERTAWTEASRQAEATNRETEHLRRLARDRIIDDAHATIARQDAAAGQLRSAAQQLRDHIPRLAAAAGAGEAPGDPAAATGGAAAAGAGLVLAELYRGADLEAIELAEAFDRARGAGLACERSYDSLSAAR